MRLGFVLAILAATLALVAVLLGSCSGESKRLSYPEFQQTASAICLRYHRRLAKLGAPTSLKKIALIARRAYSLGQNERDVLQDMRPPREAADGFSKMLDGFERADALLPELANAATAGDAAPARRLIRQGRTIVREANVYAQRIGLSDCRRT
jgi:hypothetical protein